MKMITSFLLIVFFSTFTFAGTKEDLEQVQRNLLDLQQQFWNLDSTLKTNNTALQNTAKKLEEATDQLRDNQAALNAKLESILNQVQALSEKLDETNRRMKDLASSGYQRPAIVNPNPDLNAPANQTTTTPGDYVPPQANANQSQGAVSEQQLFQSAKAQYSQGKFEQALRGFQDLLDQYPGSSLADDAQYMIGESYYNMKEYVDAVAEYDKVIKRYPDSGERPRRSFEKSVRVVFTRKEGTGRSRIAADCFALSQHQRSSNCKAKTRGTGPGLRCTSKEAL